VVVALVVVERVDESAMMVVDPVKMFPPVNVLLSIRSVVDAPVPLPVDKHTLLIAKHPDAIEIPLPNVDVAVPVTANDPVVVALVVVERVAVIPTNDESIVVEVAVKFVATTAPATDSFANGEVVPIPTFPELRIVRIEDDAFDTNSAIVGFVEVAHTVSAAYGVDVPIATRGLRIPPPPVD